MAPEPPEPWGYISSMTDDSTQQYGVLHRIVRWVVTPFTWRVYERVDNRTELALNARLEDLNEQLARADGGLSTHIERSEQVVAAIEERLQAIELHLPLLLNTISSQHAAERQLRRDLDALADRATVEHIENRARDVADALHERISEVEHRLEFVRREIMYEIRFGGREASAPWREPAAATDRPRLTALEGPLQLNLGAGHHPMQGWVNVDNRDLDGIDCVADVRALPCDPATVHAIHAAHLLEHFPVPELLHVVLPHWRDVLIPHGSLVVVVPDGEAMLAAYNSGELSFDDFRTVTFGEQEYVGDDHHTMFSATSLCALLEKAGFEEAHVVEAARRNGLSLEMEVHATAPPPNVR